MRRAHHRVSVLALAAALAVAGGPVAVARADSAGHITSYAATGVVSSDGSLRVSVDLAYAGTGGPGPTFQLPLRAPVAGDDTHWRLLDVSGMTLRSTTGAPDTSTVARTDAELSLTIAPTGGVVGEQRYVLQYVVTGVVAAAGPTGTDVSWPVLRTATPVDAATATLRGPGKLDHVDCTVENAPCERRTNQNGDVAEFEQGALASDATFTVAVRLAAGSVQAPAPTLADRDDGGVRAGWRTAGMLLAGLAAVIAVGWWQARRAWRRS